jgi:hypothetical protein
MSSVFGLLQCEKHCSDKFAKKNIRCSSHCKPAKSFLKSCSCKDSENLLILKNFEPEKISSSLEFVSQFVFQSGVNKYNYFYTNSEQKARPPSVPVYLSNLSLLI